MDVITLFHANDTFLYGCFVSVVTFNFYFIIIIYKIYFYTQITINMGVDTFLELAFLNY